MAAKMAGGGGGKYSLGQNADINVTPFVDILLVLLIIFMVAVPLATTSIKIDLPPAVDQPKQDKPKKAIFISLQKDGQIQIAEKPSQIGHIVEDLSKAEKENDPTIIDTSQERVMIRADADVKYDRFMTVVNELQTAGYYKVGLINEDIS